MQIKSLQFQFALKIQVSYSRLFDTNDKSMSHNMHTNPTCVKKSNGGLIFFPDEHHYVMYSKYKYAKYNNMQFCFCSFSWSCNRLYDRILHKHTSHTMCILFIQQDFPYQNVKHKQNQTIASFPRIIHSDLLSHTVFNIFNTWILNPYSEF